MPVRSLAKVKHKAAAMRASTTLAVTSAKTVAHWKKSDKAFNYPIGRLTLIVSMSVKLLIAYLAFS